MSKAERSIQLLQRELDDWKRYVSKQHKEHSTALQAREELINSQALENTQLKETVSSFNTYIANLNRAQEAVYQDSTYVEQLDTLNHFTQSSVASMFKWSCEHELSKEAALKVRGFLKEMDPYGKATLDILTRYGLTISDLHKDSTTRIILIRHIIALFLWKNVFSPFAFGLNENLSHNVQTLENNIFLTGKS